ncbi:MAG TPA: adenylate/guanylate cyclase domain-containing protein [Aeromicrobium sp.]|nr:adenylate/guanylate cyclase domain-containing protein [Aeromicrobium sp.]HKY58100.1 adenylate/guanylate cyclase domain-containing protein [Aeromicrobium sp.]
MTEAVEDPDPPIDADALAEALLGERIALTRREVAARTGVPADSYAALWRTMGYPDVDDEDVAFTRADVESLKATARLFDLVAIDEASEEAFARTIGRTFSRLAEWQVRAMLPSVADPATGRVSDRELRKLRELLKLTARVQENVWRRHLAGAATRLAVQYGATADEWEPACAGFVDIVGFTGRSRSMSGRDLAAFVDRFEGVVSDLVAEHGGRVVKTIGDEVFFVVDDPVEAAWLGVELAAQSVHDPTFPNVRVGMAYGDVLHRLGDVLGPVVNMASRLTSVALPGRVIIDPRLADRVKGAAGLRLRKVRRINVKGFDSVQPWSLKLTREDRSLRNAFEDLLEDATEDLAMRLPRSE